jgi:hypothetical protein
VTDDPIKVPIPEATGTIQDQLVRAVRDLWATVAESGEDYVVFTDRRRLSARVQQTPSGAYRVLWETEDGDWIDFEGSFDNLREAAFHAYQGPH